jgi:SAM-dependent methyltransferase
MNIMKFKKNIMIIFSFIGFSPNLLIKNILGLRWYFKSLRQLKKQIPSQKEFYVTSYFPVLTDRNAESGFVQSHYFWQDFFVARKIFINKPEKHVDIGSRIDGFVTHVASFREIEIFDIRPLNVYLENIKFLRADLSENVFDFHEYCDSISCLHVIEHFGLGRYGDKVDINGHIKGLENIKNILKPGGKFYFSTPIGPQRIEFNAHRVFSLRYLIELFSDNYIFDSISIIDDKSQFHNNVKLTQDAIDDNFGCHYGCVILEMIKK